MAYLVKCAFPALLWLATVACTFAPWVPLLNAKENTLANNGQWMSFKGRLGMPLFGEESYWKGAQALAGNRLNLHPWHGFQEILWREKVAPRTISFSFLLGANSHLSLVYNRTFDAFDGLRFSTAPEIPSIRFTAARGGEFTSREPLPGGPVKADTWHECRAEFDNGRISVTLDDAVCCGFAGSTKEKTWFGFKSGANPASVDDVFIRLADGRNCRERFDVTRYYPETARRIAPWAIALEIALGAGLYAAVRSPLKTLTWLNAVHIWAAAAGVTLLSFNSFFYETRYPAITAKVKKQENKLLNQNLKTLRFDLKKNFGTPKPPDTQRVLVVGTSQTWGAGAFSRDETILAQLDAGLNNGGNRVETIPGAIPGATSLELRVCLEEDWLAFAPGAVLVNLSCNDRNPSVFTDNLEKMAAKCREKNIPILFVLEALSPEIAPLGDPNHGLMRDLAGRLGIPLLDAHAFLRGKADDGFLFWDVVHLTDFGQRLLAEFLIPAIQKALEKNVEKSASVFPPVIF